MTKIFIKTFGCSLNQADSERMSGLLHKSGFELVSAEDVADLIIVNTCTVKQPTQKKVLNYLERIKPLGKHVVVAGCIPQASPELLAGYSLIGTGNIDETVSVVEETLNRNTVSLIVQGHCERLLLPKIRKNSVVEIMPISEGCLGDCHYCIVKHARGRLRSYKPELILETARKAAQEGVKELWLTAQDTGCYGSDIGTNLASLIRQVTSLPGKFMVRVGMMNPAHAAGIAEELAEAFADKKVFKFLHIPVQSGNDEILRKMNRRYTTADFKFIVQTVRQRIPEITLSTDIICGFPGETREQFNDSINLIKELRPDVLNISRFWPRPRTEAEAMEQLNGEEKKDRSRFLSSVFHYIAHGNNKKWRGWTGEIIIDEKGKGGSWIGRNFCYKPVVVHGKYKLGQEILVMVNQTTKFDLMAEEVKGLQG